MHLSLKMTLQKEIRQAISALPDTGTIMHEIE
jgi:hypothetical protein